MEVGRKKRRTLCLRQYYLDQVFGYNLSTVQNYSYKYERLMGIHLESFSNQTSYNASLFRN